ncbi:MAG: zinc dependent phospholipase C family protein [Christensenellales bacterium]
MPDCITHACFGGDVLKLLDKDMRAPIARNVFDLATLGPDPWFFHRFWQNRGRGGVSERGHLMHKADTGKFLCAIVDAAFARESAAQSLLYSYAAGFMCHYALDSAAHPYINARAKDIRGGHMRIERTIDCHFRDEYGTFGMPSIGKTILRLKKIPSAMREGLDAVYKAVYGWERATDGLNQSLRDQRAFYALAQDKWGIVDRALRLFDSGKGAHDLSALSYYGKENAVPDALNIRRMPWRNPAQPNDERTESFLELYEGAKRRAAAMISASFRYVYGISREHPAETIGNFSYSTGLSL